MFFSFFDMYQSHHLAGCHATEINSSLIFFQMFCVVQVYYGKPKASSSQKHHHMSLLENVISPEYFLKKSILSYANKAL